MTSQKETENFDTRKTEQIAQLQEARALLTRYNATAMHEQEERREILGALLGERGDGVWIEPPFHCDYGRNISLGDGVFFNFNCVLLDGDEISIGSGTLLGPAVQVYATTHPSKAEERIYVRDGLPAYHTQAKPVRIGKNAWIGGGAIILPGVEIGDGTTIGAGSVVTKTIPGGVFAAGNPCSIVREL